MRELLLDPQIWKLASIPLVAALVGWLASAATMAMTFRPLVFRGPRLFGWQGTVPRRARRVAERLVDRVLLRVVGLRELVAAIDPVRIGAHVVDVVERRIDGWTDEIMYFRHPTLWRLLPDLLKRNLTGRVRAEVPRIVAEVVGDVAARVEDLVDLRTALVERLAADPDLLVRLVRGPAAPDLRFVRRVGAFLGYAFGTALLAAVILWPSIVWLPAGLALIGALAGPLALMTLFRPAAAWRLGPLTIQGHFLRRRAVIARAWAELLAGEILTVQQLAYAMLHGPRAERAREVVRFRIQALVDDLAAAYGPVAGLATGSETLDWRVTPTRHAIDRIVLAINIDDNAPRPFAAQFALRFLGVPAVPA